MEKVDIRVRLGYAQPAVASRTVFGHVSGRKFSTSVDPRESVFTLRVEADSVVSLSIVDVDQYGGESPVKELLSKTLVTKHGLLPMPICYIEKVAGATGLADFDTSVDADESSTVQAAAPEPEPQKGPEPAVKQEGAADGYPGS